MYHVKIERHVKIPMRDGVELCADLYRPDADEPFPVVMEYLPYRKDDRSHARQALHVELAKRGYIGCRLDVRGTGSSQGIAEDEYTETEQLDAVDAIAWLAEQPFTNGKVAMWGISYGGFNAVQVAMHRPPALKAIVPIMFTDDRYKEECHYAGGSLRALYTWSDYPLMMVALNALPPHPEAFPETWLKEWRRRLEEQPVWVLKWLQEQCDGEYWYQGSLNQNYDAIECAVLAIGGWRDGYTNTPLRTFANLKSPKKALIGPWTHALPHAAFPGPKIDYLSEVLRFFDHWLKDIDNGVMDEPPINVYVQEHDTPRAIPDHWRGYWRSEMDWPHPQGKTLELHLGPQKQLLAKAPQQEGRASFHYNPTVGVQSGIWCWALPVEQRHDDVHSLLFETAPIKSDLEIIGEPTLEVSFSATAKVAGLCAHLVDVAPDGTAVMVSKGYLNATRRNSWSDPEPLTPGTPYPLKVTLDCTAWRFRAGHRLRLSLAGTEWPNIWPTPYPSEHSVHWGGAHSARLSLPRVPLVQEEQIREFPSPRVLEPIAESFEPHTDWSVVTDQLSQEVTVKLQTSSQMRSLIRDLAFKSVEEATATVHPEDPSKVIVRGVNSMELEEAGLNVKATAHATMTGTPEVFQVMIQLEVLLDDRPFFDKRWDVSLPRQLM